jgi:hypothetical protein
MIVRGVRRLRVPELFLGLLAVALAVVLTARSVTGVIRDRQHLHDTISVTGSARKPIGANLVRWSLTVRRTAPDAARAARGLRGDVGAVEAFLRSAGIPADAISPAVVTAEVLVTQLPGHRRLVRYRVAQRLDVRTRQIDLVEPVARRIGDLLERGIDVSARPLRYLSTDLTQAKLDALPAATADARRRAQLIVEGLGGKLGAMRSSSLGVYQVTPRDSTDVSDYGINDTTSREKDVIAVVRATFAVER